MISTGEKRGGEKIVFAIPAPSPEQAEPAKTDVHPDFGPLWSKCGVLPRHKMLAGRLDLTRNPQWTADSKRLVAKFKETPDLMAAMIGKRGTGKTQAAVELIRIACKMGRPAMYCTAMQFFARVKSTYNSDEAATESTVIHDFAKPALLVIDEIQVRSDSSWENNLLTHLVDLRYGNMLATVFIGNVTENEFLLSVGSSIHSRIAQTGGIIEYNGPSWRDPAA